MIRQGSTSMSSETQAAAATERPSGLTRPNVVVEPGEPRAKLLLLGDAPAVISALPAGVGIPVHPNTAVWTAGLGVCLWLRPNQRLLLLSASDGAVGGAVADTVARIRGTSAPDAWALDAGARYGEFEVSGPDARAVLSTGCSLDFREPSFPVDTCAQTRFDRIPVLLLRTASECFEVFVERPLSSHLWRWLCRAADDV
jgi:heterotetrameric sarcosine oxidase gamma subunit